MPEPSSTELAKGFSVMDYKRARDASDRKAIAKAIQRRFTERYILPVTAKHGHKHGFTIMAVSCLMIEALESFRRGWVTSDGKSRDAFCYFFAGCDAFEPFRSSAQEFYKHVRCGILHQAETTGGWKIGRKGPLLASDGRTINATRFINELERALDGFCGELAALAWDDPQWKLARTKMDSICDHCVE